MKKKVAIFDIDGTIFRSSLLIELIQAMIGAGFFPASITKSYVKEYKAWLDRKGPYEKYINKMIMVFRREIRGVNYKKFAAITRQVARFHQNRVYRFTRDLIRDLKKRGYYLLAISHSPKEVAQAFGKGFGFNKIYGAIGEEDEKGRLTGKVLYEEFIFDKAKVLERAVQKENLTLRGSVGVGDTESDIPFLKMVALSICFNPNKKLYDYARRVGWEIVVERKDVIYNVEKKWKKTREK